MNCAKEDVLLYAITDRGCLKEHTLIEAVRQALSGGATLLQLREKNLEEEAFLEEAKEIKKLCKEFEVPLIINDNVRIAKEIDADGVHVGQGDLSADEVRKILGKNKIIGVSARTVAQAKKAQEDGADYLGVGAVFTTSSKKDAAPVSLQTLREICSSVTIPAVAIGGINKDNVMQLKGTGINGIAVISGVFGTPNIKQAADELKALTKQMLAE